MSPVLRSIAARISCSWPYLERPAFWIACSIASSTSSRSIPFSRATASATCNNSRRGTTILASIFPLLPRAASLHAFGRQQFISEHQFRAAYLARGQFDLSLDPGHANLLARDAEKTPFEAALALDRFGQLHRRLVPGETPEIGK